MLDITNWNYVGHNCINATPRETPHTRRMWAAVRHRAADWTSTDYSRCRWNNRGDVEGRDVNETLANETETRPRHLVFGPRRDRDQDLPAIPRDWDETKTSDFCHETRPRPYKAETETFFETFNLQHCAKTMSGEPASLDVTNSSITATAMFIIMKFIHHISIMT